MQIAALQKLTLLDFPGRTACTVFTPGCNFRCGYCHNPELVLPKKVAERTKDLISETAFFNFLKKRRGLLDGVCVTGGEPTLQKDLPAFLAKIRALGFETKLDTNGSNPEVLKKLFDTKLLDFVALDVKASPTKYKKLVGADVFRELVASKNLLEKSGIEYELRTTLVRELVDKEEFVAILKFVRGTPKFFLQNFVAKRGCLDPCFEKFHGFTKIELEKMCAEAEEFVKECGVRD